jgi:hypothetical protein
MRKTFCDRCKHEFEYGDKLDLMTKAPYEVCIESHIRSGFGKNPVDYGRKPVDLCPDCQEQLIELVDNFMKGADQSSV